MIHEFDLDGTVDTMLAAAGIDATASEREQLLGMYAYFKPRIEAMFELEQARESPPATVFSAEPRV